MAIITLDTDSKVCYCVFPKNGKRGDKVWIGKVIASCQPDPDIRCGDDILAAGSSVQFISDRNRSDETIFEVIATENNNRRSDDDPYLYAIKVQEYLSPNKGATKELEEAIELLCQIKIAG